MTRRRWVVVLLAAALLLLVGRAVAGVYVDYQWYASLGAESLWRSRVRATLLLCGLSGLAASAFVFANLYAVRSSVVSLVLPRRVANIEIGQEVPGRYLVSLAGVLSVMLGALLTIPQNRWTELALATMGRPFGESDPYFERDLGFFVYWLPLERTLHEWALITLLVVTAIVLLLYALTPSLRWEQGTLHVSHYVRRHLVVLASILLVLLAWGYRLDAYMTLLDGSRPDGGFGYTDHHATIPVSVGLSILTLVSAFVVGWSGWTGQIRVAFAVVGVVLVLSVGVRHLAPPIARRLAPASDPAVRERPYEATRARYTRRAYALDRIARADSSLHFRSLASAASFVALWDAAALVRWATRARRDEGAAAGVGWRSSRFGLLAVIPMRPMAAESPPDQSPWSVMRVLASKVDFRGEPVHVWPDGRANDEQQLGSVVVFVDASGYLVVNDSLSRIAGPSLRSGLSRLAHAWSLQNFRLLFGEIPQPSPRIVIRRDVRERVRRLAPFFTPDSVIHPIVWADTLYWCVPLFATSATYPLSLRTTLAGEEWSYVHHAATGLVNAHTGRVTIVADSVLETIGASWAAALPQLFTRWSRLPSALEAAVPPSISGTRARAAAFARVGSRDWPPAQGILPWNGGADSLFVDAAEPMFALPAHDSTLAWTVPVLDASDHVRGLVIATGGSTGALYWQPLDTAGLRWSAVIDELHRAPDSAVASPRDARLVRGAVRALPLGGPVAYAQPAYAWRATGPPTLERVSVLTGTTLAVGRTLADAGRTAPAQADTIAASSPLTFRARVSELYEEMRSALQRGDWSAFGRAYDELGQLLRTTPP